MTETPVGQMLTTENVDDLAQQLRALLNGKTFTVTATEELFQGRAEVRKGMQLKGTAAEAVKAYHREGGATIFLSDTTHTVTLPTNLVEDVYDPDFNNPCFAFESDRVEINYRSDSGHHTKLEIVLETEDVPS